jgi:hypothetical protein
LFAISRLALSSTITDCKVLYSDFKPLISKYVISQWQEYNEYFKTTEGRNTDKSHERTGSANQETGNKLHSNTPEVDMSNLTVGLSRREELVIRRASIGHTYLIHAHLLKGEDAPTCMPGDCSLTVEHVLISCIDFSPTCEKYFKVCTDSFAR